jgi:hypothetical protein
MKMPAYRINQIIDFNYKGSILSRRIRKQKIPKNQVNKIDRFMSIEMKKF